MTESTVNAIEVVLEGGPAGLPTKVIIDVADGAVQKIKLPYQGGYEHFQLAGRSGAQSGPVYRWTMRTCIAE